MKRNYEGCALCDATWGDYWREVEGENMFFCCNVCADAFENMIKKVKDVTGWEKVDSVHIEGNYSRGRNCVATSGEEKIDYFFRHEDGVITEFAVKNQGTRPVP
jgi:hypothetical protein